MKILFIIACLLLSGCTAHQYTTTQHYIPTHTRKGETTFNYFLFNSAQVGYSLTDRISLFATGYIKKSLNQIGNNGGKEDSGHASRSGKEREINIGASYFIVKNYFIYEILIGGGRGKISYNHTRDWVQNYSFRMNSPKRNIYVQPVFRIKTNDNIHFGIFSKVNAIVYHNLSTAFVQGDNFEVEPNDVYFLNRKRIDLVFIEPGFFIKGGTRHFKLALQYSRAYNLMHYKLNFRPYNIHLGICISTDAFEK